MRTLSEHLERRLAKIEARLVAARDAQSAAPQTDGPEGAERRAQAILALKRQHHEVNVCITYIWQIGDDMFDWDDRYQDERLRDLEWTGEWTGEEEEGDHAAVTD